MSDVSKELGLFKPKGTNVYYYRRRVPQDLVAKLKKSELKRSLQTADIREAKVARNRLAAEWDDLFRRTRLSHNQATEPSRRSAPYSVLEIDSTINRYVEVTSERQLADLANGDLDPSERGDRIIEAQQAIADYEGGSDDATRMDVASAERMIFGSKGLTSLARSERSAMEASLRRALLEIERRWLAALESRFERDTFDSRFKPAGKRTTTLRELSEQYLADYRGSRLVGLKRSNKVARDHEMILEYFGPDIAIEHIDRTQIRAFLGMLAEFPAHATQHFRADDFTISQIISEGKRLKLKKLARNTQENYFRTLKMLLEWAQQEGLLLQNRANGLEVAGEKAPPNEARWPFSSAQLKAIFSAPLYTGCEDDLEGYAKPGKAKPRGTRFWVPVIGLLTGMRLNEICQLLVSDIRTSDAGVSFISVNDDDGKRLKNRHSKRNVPVHHELERIGFSSFVKRRAEEGAKSLFPDIKTSKHGYKSERMSRWFNEGFLAKAITKGPKQTFHSFRHTMQDAMRDAGLTAADRGAICGWNEEKSAGANYGSGPSIERLAGEFRKVSLGVDLSHLYE